MKIAFDRNLVCRKILFSEISSDLLAFILKKSIKYKTMHVYRKGVAQAGSPQDHMATDSWEGNKGDGEDLGGHQVHGQMWREHVAALHAC